jgi:FMN phosphatase YigB (HAD superfamily)
VSVINSDIKAVVLDIDGTLCSLTKGVGEIYAELLAAKGHLVEVPTLREAVASEWRSFEPLYLNEAQGYQTTPAREREVWCEYVRGVLVRVGLSAASRDELVGYIYSAFATKNHRRVAEGASEFLVKARHHGIRVVAATNNDERSKSVLRELGVLENLSGVLTAGELGWKKPSPRFYKTLEDRMGVEPSGLVHVGNSVAFDIDPALQAGWRAILFGSSPDPAVRSVSSFAGLEEMVGI